MLEKKRVNLDSTESKKYAITMTVSEEVKTYIRSVLLSKVGGILVNELNRDYKKLIGQPILYKKWGYPTLEAMIKSIPDVARIKSLPDGNRVFGILNNPKIMNHTAIKAQYRPDNQEEEMPKLEKQGDALKWQDELQPNLRGLYCLCMRKSPGLSREVVDKEFSKYGEVVETSYTERYVFVRFAKKDHALAALNGLIGKYDVKIPTEKNNPRRVIKEKDVTGEMPPYPTAKASDDRIVKSKDTKSQMEVFIGNLHRDTTRADLQKLVSEFNVLNVRLRGHDEKRFAFVLVPDESVCEEIVSKLHRATFKGRLLIAQGSYENAEKRTPQESKVILQSFVKGGLEGKMAVAKTADTEEMEDIKESNVTPQKTVPNKHTTEKQDETHSQSRDKPNHVTTNGMIEKISKSPPPHPSPNIRTQKNTGQNDETIGLSQLLQISVGKSNRPSSPNKSLNVIPQINMKQNTEALYHRQNHQNYPDDLPELEECDSPPRPARPYPINRGFSERNSKKDGQCHQYSDGENFHGYVKRNQSHYGINRYDNPEFHQYNGGEHVGMYNGQNSSYYENRNDNCVPPWGYNQHNGFRQGGYGPRQPLPQMDGRNVYMTNHGRNMRPQSHGNWGPAVYDGRQNSFPAEYEDAMPELICDLDPADEEEERYIGPIVVGSDMTDMDNRERCFDLYCSGFPFGTYEEELLQVFLPYGASRVKMKNNAPGSKTFAFIVFENYEDASDAFTNLDGQQFNGRILNVSFGRKSVINDRDLAKKMGNLKCTVTVDQGEERRMVTIQSSKRSSSSQHGSNTGLNLYHQNQRPPQDLKSPAARNEHKDRLDSGDNIYMYSVSDALHGKDPLVSQEEENFEANGGTGRHGTDDTSGMDHRMQISHGQRGGSGNQGGGDNRGERNAASVGLGRGAVVASLKQQRQQPLKPERQRSRNDSWETVSDASGPSSTERMQDVTLCDHSSPLPMATLQEEAGQSVPVSMRQNRLQQIYEDCFPEAGFPDLTGYHGTLTVIPRVTESAPGYFWGQLFCENMTAALALVSQIAELESTSNLSAYTQVCKRAAAFFEEEWYRVWVEAVVSDQARVFFVDWGNMETLPVSNLRQLPEEFWTVQPSALPFKLGDHDNVTELLDQQVELQFLNVQDPPSVVTVKFVESHAL